MGRGSPICERVSKKIVEYFKNNIPRCRIAKALQISSSTVHNIIKRFRETGEISMSKGQGQMTFVGCPWSSGAQTTLHHSWAWFCHWHYILWAKAHLKWTVSKWKSVLWSDESKFDILVGNHGRRVLRAKEEGDLPACYQQFSSKASISDGMGVHKCIRYGQHYVLEGTMNAERYVKVLEQHMLPSRQCVFQQDNTKPYTAAITTAWLCSSRVRVLNWTACSPDLSPIENIWCIIKWKIRQRWPQTLHRGRRAWGSHGRRAWRSRGWRREFPSGRRAWMSRERRAWMSRGRRRWFSCGQRLWLRCGWRACLKNSRRATGSRGWWRTWFSRERRAWGSRGRRWWFPRGRQAWGSHGRRREFPCGRRAWMSRERPALIFPRTAGLRWLQTAGWGRGWSFGGYRGIWGLAGGRSHWRGMWGFSAWGELGRRGTFQLERDDEAWEFPLLPQPWNQNH